MCSTTMCKPIRTIAWVPLLACIVNLAEGATDLRVDVALGVVVKFGTADATEGLGTRQIDVLQEFEQLAVSGMVGYKQCTSYPGLHLRNVVFAAIDGDYPVSVNTRAAVVRLSPILTLRQHSVT